MRGRGGAWISAVAFMTAGLAVAALAAGCFEPRKVRAVKREMAEGAEVADSSYVAPGEPTPYELLSAEVVGDSLRVQVAYSGGCGEHFWYVSPAGPLMKSLPPKQPLRLEHRSPGDPCRARFQETFTFDLRPYRGTPRGVTVILLENWNTPLTYAYD
ncbi:MAG: hypothetical protein RJA19_1403 [Bacteroidota bacterium]